MLTPSPEDVVLAKQLVAEGWQSTSHKHRMIARLRAEVPAFENGVTFSPEVPEWFREQVRKAYSWVGHRYIRMAPDEAKEIRQLTVAEFRAFRNAGGETA